MSADKVHARYSMVERRVWKDPRFRELSAPEPNGRDMWLFLLTSSNLGVLPGLIAAGEGALADEIGWDIDGFRAAFAEVEAQGMATADWKARLVVLPKVIAKAFERRTPESPNVIRGWRLQWLEVPDCDLKVAYYHQLRELVSALPKSYLDAFDAAIQPPNPSRKQTRSLPESKRDRFPKANAVPSPNQEQDQDQEQEPEIQPTHTPRACVREVPVEQAEEPDKAPKLAPAEPVAPVARRDVKPENRREFAPTHRELTSFRLSSPPPARAEPPSFASHPPLRLAELGTPPPPAPPAPESSTRAVSLPDPPDLCPEAAELLAELRGHPALGAAATPALAKQIWGRALAKGHPVTWIREAISDAARDIDAEVAVGGTPSRETVAKQVVRYAARARAPQPLPAPRAPVANANRHSFARGFPRIQPWTETDEEREESRRVFEEEFARKAVENDRIEAEGRAKQARRMAGVR